MKIAFIYDRVNKWGGAERVLLALHEIWPDAPLFTAVYDPKGAPWASVFDVRPSWMQHVPFAARHHEWYPWLTPLAFESSNFDAYDVVISVTSAEAKAIITKPDTLHICYCLTPTRYLWSGYDVYAGTSGALRMFAPTLRRWDMVASSRPDYYIAISERVRERIKQYYGREVEKVIYPPVDTRWGEGKTCLPAGRVGRGEDGKYFLVVSRLVPYKRVDIIIEAFNKLGWRLIIIGDGTERKKLQEMARENIVFVKRHLTEEELVGYHQRCAALVVAADEDFGIAAVEVQAAGKPVVAYRKSGVEEIIREDSTGLFFEEQSVKSLIGSLERFQKQAYDPKACRNNAMRFGVVRFQQEMKETVETLYNKYKNT